MWLAASQSRNLNLETSHARKGRQSRQGVRLEGRKMAHAITPGGDTHSAVSRGSAVTLQPAYQAYLVLYVGFVVLPIVAGLDKFFHVLVDWDLFLSSLVTQLLPFTGHTFMQIVGVVEIVAGLLVAIYPRIGAYVVMLWLWGIIVNLLLVPGFYDIALRDFGLSLGALALARLSQEFTSNNHLGP
jgi:hypothetical protein